MAESRTVARPYAKAAFAQALAQAQLSQWSTGLNTLSAVASQPAVESLIATPSLTANDKAAQLINICADDLNGEMRNFVQVLADNKRLSLLPEVVELFEELKAEQESSVNIVVNSAYPLDGELENRLAAALKQKLQREVTVETAIDKTLLGGALIKAGDIVIDSSVKGRLAKLTEAMNL